MTEDEITEDREKLMITLSLKEYEELLVIKGKYEALKTIYYPCYIYDSKDNKFYNLNKNGGDNK